MLMPKRVKYRRVHRGDRSGKTDRGTTVAFGELGLQATEPAWVDSRQIEAARRAITHHMKRGGKVWIRIFPDKSVTAKPAETRMGSGKGAPDHWVAVVRPGRVLFEVSGVREDLAREALRLAAYKLPLATQVVVKETPASLGASLPGRGTAAAAAAVARAERAAESSAATAAAAAAVRARGSGA